MLMLDMPMPERCLDCPLFRLHYDCGQCMGTAEKKWIEPEDYRKRQEWCPLKEQPLVDAVSVVRCKDCIYWTPHGSNGGACEFWECQGISSADYCSTGERKERDGNE